MVEKGKRRSRPEARAMTAQREGYLTTKQAAYYLGLSVRTLEGLRQRRRGPQGYRIGRGWYYDVRDVERWARKVRCGRA